MYGGAAAAEAAGFKLPPPDELAKHIDWATWKEHIRQLAALLQQDDVEQVCQSVSDTQPKRAQTTKPVQTSFESFIGDVFLRSASETSFARHQHPSRSRVYLPPLQALQRHAG